MAAVSIVGSGMAGLAAFADSNPEPTSGGAVCSSGGNPMGGATPNGSADGYTIFVTEDAVLANSELEGSLAVGGKATFGAPSGHGGGQYPIVHSIAGNANYSVPTIEGDHNRLLIQEFVPYGDKVVQVKSQGATGTNAQAGAKIGDQTLPEGYTFRQAFGLGTTFYPMGGTNQSPQIESQVQPWTDLAAAQESWGITGDVLSHFPEDAGSEILETFNAWEPVDAPAGNDQPVVLTGNGPSKLPLSAFAGIQKFKLQNYSENSFLVIKVSPTDVVNGSVALPSYSFAGQDASYGAGISHILFDFSAVDSKVEVVSAEGSRVRGAIYAPNAHIVFPNGGAQFEGQLIAKNFTALHGGEELHTNIFMGRFPGDPSECNATGTFNLRKVLSGVDAAKFPAGTTFPVTATWAVGDVEESKTFDLPADGTVVPSELTLPEGTVVTLVEGALPDAPAGYSFVSSGLSSDSITILADNNEDIAWSVTNTYKEDEVVVRDGTFNLRKIVNGVDAAKFPEGTTFPVTATWTVDGVGGSKTFDLPADGTAVPSGLELREGTVVSFVEGDLPDAPEGYSFVSSGLSSNSITILADNNTDIAWSVTNTYKEDEVVVQEGTFNLRKILSGVDAAKFPEGTVFPVTATWIADDVEESVTYQLPADGTVIDSELMLPEGTVVTLVEGTLPDAPEGYSFVSSGLSSDTITILADDNADIAWSVTNTYGEVATPEAFGSFNLRKILSGVDAAKFPEGTVFPVTATWIADDVEESVTYQLPADGTVIDSELMLPEGTVVTLVEGTLPDAPEGYSFVSSGLSSDTITILADNNADIAWSVTNTYKEDEVVVQDGTFNLRKVLSGVDAAKFPEGTTFPVTATWTADGIEESATYELPADGTVVDAELALPADTVVTLAEGALPDAPAGYSFVSSGLSADTITILADDNADIAWSVTNTYGEVATPEVFGSFNLRKILSGVDAAKFPEGTVFPVTATWTVDGQADSKVFALPADGTVVDSELALPEGTVVTLVEGTLPDAPEGYTFVSSGVSAESITILADDNADIAWSVTNTYGEVATPETFGGFDLAKVLKGVTADDLPKGTVFTVVAKWTVDGEEFSEEFALPADGTVVEGPKDLPIGTVVSFEEVKIPTVKGYTFKGVEFSANDIEITDGETLVVSATNTYQKDGSLAVTGATAPGVAGAALVLLILGGGALALLRRREWNA